MKQLTRLLGGLLLAAAVILSTNGVFAQSDPDDAAFEALVFSKTEGFRHGSISLGKEMLQELSEQHNFAIDTTEDASAFTAENLAQYDVVVFLSSTGDILNDAQEQAFQQFIQNGGGFAGIHAAADAERDWDWYKQLIGAYEVDHYPQGGTVEATVHVEDSTHPSTEPLPETWVVDEEWYNFDVNPRENDVEVLLTVDESSYGGGTMGEDHPIAWYKEHDGGRAWYTALGHSAHPQGIYTESLFRQHVLGGLRWAAGTTETTNTETETAELPRSIELGENYPNPFNPATTIPFAVSEDARVQLAVYDNQGREVAVLVDERRTPGRYRVRWTPGDIASGIYFYRLRVGDMTRSREMILVK